MHHLLTYSTGDIALPKNSICILISLAIWIRGVWGLRKIVVLSFLWCSGGNMAISRLQYFLHVWLIIHVPAAGVCKEHVLLVDPQHAFDGARQKQLALKTDFHSTPQLFHFMFVPQ